MTAIETVTEKGLPTGAVIFLRKTSCPNAGEREMCDVPETPDSVVKSRYKNIFHKFL